MIEVKEIFDKKQLKDFVGLTWYIYKEDNNWVPPLKFDLINTLIGKNNPLFMTGTHTFFMAYKDNKPCGRLLVGINDKLNQEKSMKDGYISLFECINDKSVAFMLFNQAVNWLKARGMDHVKGPISPTNGDDYKGLLVMGFDGAPVLMNSYNPEYYMSFFEQYGFVKHIDLYAYLGDFTDMLDERYGKVIEYAMRRYNFTVEPLDLKNIDKELLDIKQVMDIGMPEDWEDLTPPSMDEIRAEANKLKFMIDPNLIWIARWEGKPIGFNVALPDYNEVLKQMNGRILPFGIFKFLWYKAKIKGIRSFIMFVVPEFRKKGVSGAIYYKCYEAAKRGGYTHGEGSTIGEPNTAMRRDAEGAGGKHYKTYRIYEKEI